MPTPSWLAKADEQSPLIQSIIFGKRGGRVDEGRDGKRKVQERLLHRPPFPAAAPQKAAVEETIQPRL